MAEPFDVSPRMTLKWRLFNERKGPRRDMLCELCHDQPATDLHEIVNRVHYPPEMVNEVPEELLSLLCNYCNVNMAERVWARKCLLKTNLHRYGRERMETAINTFAAKLRGYDPDLKLLSLLE